MEWNGEESDRASKSPVERERERRVGLGRVQHL